MMNKSEQINELATALSKAQGAIKGAIKDTANPFFKSKYADLSSVWDACRDQLSANGLSIVQSPCEVEHGIGVETMLMHSSGQWISNQFTMPVSKPDAQGVGSAITYARRYALAAMVGVAPEDDDGNAATGKTDPKQASKIIETTDQLRCKSIAKRMKELWPSDAEAAYDLYFNGELDNELKLMVWGFLSDSSKMRADLKLMNEKRRAA